MSVWLCFLFRLTVSFVMATLGDFPANGCLANDALDFEAAGPDRLLEGCGVFATASREILVDFVAVLAAALP